MGKQRLERYVGLAGILFVILYVATAIFWGGVRPDESPATVTNALTGQRGAVVASAYLLLAASVALLVFAAGSSRQAAGGTPSVLSATSFGAGAISAALLAVANALLGALGGYIITGSSPETVRALNGLWDGFTTVSGLFLGVFAVAVSLLAFETQSLPRLVRWLGVVAGVVLIIGSGSLATPFHGVGPFWILGLFGTLLWIASASVWMLMRRGA